MISVSQEKENEIRKYAQEVMGGKKGSLSDFIWEAVSSYINNLKKEHERQAAVERMLSRMRKGMHIGFKGYTSREELYEPRIKKTSGH